ncbi:sensor histidine kinase [Frankia nepalensis]|uniref:sensor histidine kinase n=1 Tax=Frankia nepalensis TaxID=1836974 RepID=UPI0027DDFA00|nr:histidine kinase [Frankia nepalensis]
MTRATTTPRRRGRPARWRGGEPGWIRRAARQVRGLWAGEGPGRAAREDSARLSAWAWAADAVLAFVLAAAMVVAALDGGSLVVPRFASEHSDAPAPPERLEVPRAPSEPGLPDATAGDARDPADRGQGLGVLEPPDPADPADPPDPADRTDVCDGLVIADVPRQVVCGPSGEGVATWQLVLAALVAMPLVARRWRPLAAYWAVFIAIVLFHQGARIDDAIPFTFGALLVAAYSAAVYSPHRALAVVSLLVGAGQVLALPDENLPDFRPVYVPFVALVSLGLVANAIHLRQQRARVVAAEQVTASRRAVEQERARIARELHDVVTHNVSVMVIQAGAARMVLDHSPEQARAAMLAVERGGRAAMTELRHVMGLLTMPGSDPAADGGPVPDPDAAMDLSAPARRSAGVPAPAAGPSPATREDAGATGGRGAATGPAAGRSWTGDGPASGDGPPDGGGGTRPDSGVVGVGPVAADELTPQPGLGQLPALASRLRAAGVDVELTTTGAPVSLPAGMDLAAYRVAQEALTNAVKHAAGARVRIGVDFLPAAVRIEVTDTGGWSTVAAASGSGSGLVGLRERLAVYNGSLWVGRRPMGGFGVRAVIPLEDAPLSLEDAPPWY